MLELRVATDPRWLPTVLSDFDAFLIDHAACERKASATGMAFVVRYPDRPQIVESMIAFAREELEHFQQVYAILSARELRLAPDERDPYVRPLSRRVRAAGEERLLDRLVMGGVVEARGCERFGLLAAGLDGHETLGQYAEFYADLVRSEARHRGLFLRLARLTFDDAEVRERIDVFLDAEATLVGKLALRPALH